MSAAKALNGFRVARKRGSGSNSTGFSEYRIANGFATNIFMGDPVFTTITGFIEPMVTVTRDTLKGIFLGCRYTDPVTSKPTWSKYWPASTSSGDSTPYAFVADDGANTYFVQGDVSISVGDVGLNFQVTVGAGSTVTGRSGFGLDSATRTTSATDMQFRVIGLENIPGNAWSDGFTRVEVVFLQHQDTVASVPA